MELFKPTKTVTKQFQISFVLSLSFHLFIFIFFIISPLLHPEVTQKMIPTIIMQVELIENSSQPKDMTITKIIPAKKITVMLPTKSVKAIKSDSVYKSGVVSVQKQRGVISTQKQHVRVTHISGESLQRDISFVAENIAFNNKDSGIGVSAEKRDFSDLAYRRYVDDCRDKLTRIGNAKNNATVDGSVILHLTIAKNGEVVEKYIDTSSSDELKNLALYIIDKASPFGPFPQNVSVHSSSQNLKKSLFLHTSSFTR